MVDKIECLGAEYFVSFRADVTRSLDFRKKSKKMHDTLFPQICLLMSTIYRSLLFDDRKKLDTTHTNHYDWHQQRRLSRNNKPEIAFAPSYTELVAIVPSIVAVASTIAPRSRLLSLHFHRLIAAAESTDLGSSAAWSSTISSSEPLESHARRSDIRNCAARLLNSWKCEYLQRFGVDYNIVLLFLHAKQTLYSPYYILHTLTEVLIIKL